MALLTAEEILNSKDMGTKDIYVEEWGGDVRIRSFSVAERERIEMAFMTRKRGKSKYDTKNMRSEMLIKACINEDGSPLFTKESLEELSEKSAKPVSLVFDAISKFNGMDVEASEELEKN